MVQFDLLQKMPVKVLALAIVACVGNGAADHSWLLIVVTTYRSKEKKIYQYLILRIGPSEVFVNNAEVICFID